MRFKINPPSISKIRAKLIIECLSRISRNTDPINIFATGRTHSGKTTLGNRLLGIDYFLSTGHQDCTKETNLIEFPIGLRYFDLPGICSDDFLENYNRVSLGIEQIEDSPFVQGVTLARYQEAQPPIEQTFSLADYSNLNFTPDLIYYLIAPDKQFARGDRKYLRSLLKRHQNVIYVFNMFANKKAVQSYSATEANIQDATLQIIKVHQDIVGNDCTPVIVGVNCWTGEGISELLHQSQIMLSEQKGKIFEESIQYQRKKTPDEYVSQVKRELIGAYAHSACQRSTGTDTCDQPLHKICYAIFEFLISLPIQSEQADNSITQQVNAIVERVLANPMNLSQSESLEDNIHYLQRAIDYILNESIDSFNKLIEDYISNVQTQGYELRNQELEAWQKEKESYGEQLESKWNSILSQIEEFNQINDSIKSLDKAITNKREKIEARIEAHNASYISILSRRQNSNSRIERWKERLDRYNANVDRINRSYARVTYEARQSIEQESNYLNREIESIKSEDNYIDSLVASWQQEDKSIESEKSCFNDIIDKLNQDVDKRDRLRKAIQRLLKERNQFEKEAQDEINLWIEFIKYFALELETLDNTINARIEGMNGHLQEIKIRLTDNYSEKFDSPEDAIDELKEVVNCCLDELSLFESQIFSFHQELNCCIFRVNINKMVMQVLQKTTEHYFDEAGEFEYRGSHYHFFRQHGIAIGLALTKMTLVGLDTEYELFYEGLLEKVESLGFLPESPTESQILSLLEKNIGILFDSSIEQAIEQAVV